MDLKTIDLKTKEFMANGNKYYICDKISISRFVEYEKLLPRLTFGLNFNEMFANIKTAYESLNKQQFANSAVILHNIMNSISSVDEETRVHPSLLMAALVINKEGEDIRFFDERISLDKIKDWQEEGLDMMGFTLLSLNSIEGFKQTLIKFTQENSEIINTKIEIMK